MTSKKTNCIDKYLKALEPCAKRLYNMWRDRLTEPFCFDNINTMDSNWLELHCSANAVDTLYEDLPVDWRIRFRDEVRTVALYYCKTEYFGTCLDSDQQFEQACHALYRHRQSNGQCICLADTSDCRYTYNDLPEHERRSIEQTVSVFLDSLQSAQ